MSILEDFLGLLADIGLCHEDWKHRRKIEKKERIDGKKRPIQKYLLRPSLVIMAVIFTIVISTIYGVFRYRSKYINPDLTKDEIIAMSDRLEE